MNTKKEIRVRFAPSPTGYLHIGGLRTALYNYLFAKKNNGIFFLRLEDTDRKRYVEGSAEKLISSLQWAGIKYSEGIYQREKFKDEKNKIVESVNYPGIVEIGDFGPYIQSERLGLYKKYAQELVSKGKAYYCFCQSERLEKMREDQIKEKKPPKYDRYCLSNLSQDQINEKLRSACLHTIRLKVSENEKIEFEDLIRGKVVINSSTVDDQVLIKSDGFPTYHLASIVDDYLMGTTHVIRGEEWLPSTPKHILLYRAFGWDVPEFAHLPLLLNFDKTKLSKRQGDVAVEDYLKKGYLKEAIINFVALLGWHPGEGKTQEIFSLEELEKVFDIKRVHKSGAVFDLKKLDWINGQYIKKMDQDRLYEKTLPFLEEKKFYELWSMEHGAWSEKQKEEFIKKVLRIEQERMLRLSDVGEENQFFFAKAEDIKVSADDLRWKDSSNEDTRNNLQKAKEVLENISEDNWALENIEKKLLEAAGDRRGDLLFPLRAAITGQKKSPSPFEVAWVLGKNETLQRIENAIEILEK